MNQFLKNQKSGLKAIFSITVNEVDLKFTMM